MFRNPKRKKKKKLSTRCRLLNSMTIGIKSYYIIERILKGTMKLEKERQSIIEKLMGSTNIK